MQESSAWKKVDEYYYNPSRPISSGAFSTTYRAFHIENDQQLTVKVVPGRKFSNSNLEKILMKGVNVQKDIQSEHIVQIIDVKRTINNLYIFTELWEGETLEKKLRKGHTFTEEQACHILHQITEAFVSLGNAMHRNIKPKNILLSPEGNVKLIDFVFAKAVEEAEKEIRCAHTLLGTPVYMAPQILSDEPYSEKCDIWSTGCVFYESLFGKLPWTGYSVPNLLKNILTQPLVFPKEIRPETEDLLKKMLEYDENKRISWREIQEHPALQQSSSSS